MNKPTKNIPATLDLNKSLSEFTAGLAPALSLAAWFKNSRFWVTQAGKTVVRQASVGWSIIREKRISLVTSSYALPTLRSSSNS